MCRKQEFLSLELNSAREALERERVILEMKMSIDNKGRRSGIDRRTFTYAEYFPERRADYDRRTGIDRRKKQR